MENGHKCHAPVKSQRINEQTELRHLPGHHIKYLGDILAEDDQWKTIMSLIPGGKPGNKRFDRNDMDIIAQALRNNHMYTGFELLVDNWGTMEEWGRAKSGRRSRPKVEDLDTLCRQIKNFRAASYVNHNILGGPPVQGPMHSDNTVDLESFSGDAFNFEDSRLEDTINNRASLEDNSDIIDLEMHIPVEPALDVLYINYSYLCQITNGFSSSARVGFGGYSEVFKGETTRSKKLLAIKKLKDCPDARSQMNFEVKNLKRLKHPNIIDLYGYSNDSPTTNCLIYPLMANGSLSARLTYKPGHEKHLTSKQRLEIAYGVSKGICHIHRFHEGPKVLIHRDIKSSNILLDQNLQPKVADFGFLRLAVSGEGIESTSTTVPKGSPAYMPPEAFLSRGCSAKWDVWSFGVVLLELLTSLPVDDKERDDHHILSHVMYVVGDKGNEALEKLLDTCWHNDNMVQSANLIYKLAHTRCLVTEKYDRAAMKEVVENIGEIIGNN